MRRREIWPAAASTACDLAAPRLLLFNDKYGDSVVIPGAVLAPNVAPQASTAPATVVPVVQQSGLLRSVHHAQPTIESQRGEATSKRRRPSEEREDEGDALASEGFARGFLRARLRFQDDGDGERPVVAVQRYGGREPEEIDLDEFAEEARNATQGRPPPGLVLDAYY